MSRSLRDGLRMAAGTLTAFPVRGPARIDRRVAGVAMAAAPLVGALLGLAALPACLLVRPALLPPSLAAVLLIGGWALATRALHLDGLADTVDGLGASWDRERALRIMRTGDVGPMGVSALIIVLLIDVFALSMLLRTWSGTTLVVLAMASSRLALPWACLPRVPSARPDGLGAAVAGSVRPWVAVVETAALMAAGIGVAAATGGRPWFAALVPLGGLAVTGILLRHCSRRLGGITGDVLGALVECAFAASLVVAVLVT